MEGTRFTLIYVLLILLQLFFLLCNRQKNSIKFLHMYNEV